MIWPQHMHRTLRPPAAKVAPAPPPSTWKVRRGRGAGAGGAGHCVWRSFLQPYVRFDASVFARFLFKQRTQRSRAGTRTREEPGTRHGNQMILSQTRCGRATRRDPAHRGISDPDLTVTRAHTWTRGISTQSRRTCKWHTTQNAHGARRPNPHQPPSTQGLNRGTTGPSSPHQSQSHHKREPATQPANNRYPNTTPTNHQSPRWRWRRSPPSRVHPLALPRAPARSPPPVTRKLALGFDGWHAAAARCQRRCELQPDLIRPAVPRPPPPQWLGGCWVKPGRRLGRPRARRPPRRHPPHPDRTRMPGSPPRSR